VLCVNPFGKGRPSAGADGSGYNLDFDVLLSDAPEQIIARTSPTRWACNKANHLIDTCNIPTGAVEKTPKKNKKNALRGRSPRPPASL